MFVTAAPYTIKGAAFDCIGDAILGRGVSTERMTEKGRTVGERRRFPSARV